MAGGHLSELDTPSHAKHGRVARCPSSEPPAAAAPESYATHRNNVLSPPNRPLAGKSGGRSARFCRVPHAEHGRNALLPSSVPPAAAAPEPAQPTGTTTLLGRLRSRRPVPAAESIAGGPTRREKRPGGRAAQR